MELKKLIETSNNIVFFGGAGVSTESGIPDFRSESGIYNAVSNYGYPPEVILSHTFFMKHPETFFKFYREQMIYSNAKPNPAHISLAKLERQGRLKAVVTQNIDGLHQKAGSVNVLELHGSVLRNYCMKCNTFYGLEAVKDCDGVPLCKKCGGIIKPDVVLYEEPLNEDIILKSIQAISDADMLIVGGTSLNVHPAAGFVRYYRGGKLVLINKSETPYDSIANLLIRDNIADVLKRAVS